jgi:hypothetical protein
MNERAFVIAAYALTWATFMGYGIYLARVRRRARSLREEAIRQSRGGKP